MLLEFSGWDNTGPLIFDLIILVILLTGIVRGFLKGFVVTTFDCLIKMFPSLSYTMDNAKNNIKEWKKLSEKHRVRGWTPEKEKDKNKDSK